jgi:hypothetical protein
MRAPSAGPLPCLPADCSPLSSKLAPKPPAPLPLLPPKPPALLPLLPGESRSPGCCCRKRAMIALSAAACCTLLLLLVFGPVPELGCWVRTAWPALLLVLACCCCCSGTCSACGRCCMGEGLRPAAAGAASACFGAAALVVHSGAAAFEGPPRLCCGAPPPVLLLTRLLPGGSKLTPARLPAFTAPLAPAAAAGGLVLLSLLVRAKRARRSAPAAAAGSVVPTALATNANPTAGPAAAAPVDLCVGEVSPLSLKRTFLELLSLRPREDLEPLPTKTLWGGRLGFTAGRQGAQKSRNERRVSTPL